jgi:hypothetical protein
MQKKIVLVLAFIMVFGFTLTAKDLKLGEEIKIEKVTKVSEILENPEEYLDKKVRVEGFIIDGCMHHGTWISIAGDKDYQTLQIRHKENKLKFPLKHRGMYCIAEGTLYFIELNEEQALNWLRHLEETHGRKADLSKAKGGMKIYRISPTGAFLKDKK